MNPSVKGSGFYHPNQCFPLKDILYMLQGDKFFFFFSIFPPKKVNWVIRQIKAMTHTTVELQRAIENVRNPLSHCPDITQNFQLIPSSDK